MGTVKKIAEEYYIEFEARGLKYQQKAGADKQAALRLLKEVESKIAKGQMGVMARDADIDIFFADFSEYARSRHTLRTVTRFKGLLAHFQKFLGAEHATVNKLSQVTPGVLEHYKLYLQKKTRLPGRVANKGKIINLSFFLLWEIFQYAIKSGYLNDNPALHIELFNIPAVSRPHGLTEAEIQAIYRQSSPLLRTIIEFMLLTGMRWPDLARIRWRDIDQNKGVIHIFSSAAGRDIPITLPIKEILDSLEKRKSAESSAVFTGISGRPVDVKSLYLQFRELIYNCGLTNKVSLDCLRHTFAISLLKRGVPLADLYRYLGLSDIARAMIYAPFIPAQKRGLYES